MRLGFVVRLGSGDTPSVRNKIDEFAKEGHCSAMAPVGVDGSIETPDGCRTFMPTNGIAVGIGIGDGGYVLCSKQTVQSCGDLGL